MRSCAACSILSWRTLRTAEEFHASLIFCCCGAFGRYLAFAFIRSRHRQRGFHPARPDSHQREYDCCIMGRKARPGLPTRPTPFCRRRKANARRSLLPCCDSVGNAWDRFAARDSGNRHDFGIRATRECCGQPGQLAGTLQRQRVRNRSRSNGKNASFVKEGLLLIEWLNSEGDSSPLSMATDRDLALSLKFAIVSPLPGPWIPTRPTV